MDNQRPELDLKFFRNICPDQNGTSMWIFGTVFDCNGSIQVPVIAVFTKYDQFLRNVRIDLEDYGNPGENISDAAQRLFKEHYLHHLGDGARFVRLESSFIIEFGGCVLILLWKKCTNQKRAAVLFLKKQLKRWMMT